MVGKKLVSPGIRGNSVRRHMLPTVKFHCKVAVSTVKVKDVRVNRVLTPKLHSEHLAIPDGAPQRTFSVCGSSAEGTTQWNMQI